jgi:hypothetical protein
MGSYYQKYKEEFDEKFGQEFGFNYVGSALRCRPQIKGYSAEDLRQKMPLKDQPVKISHIQYLVQQCERAMVNAARQGKYSCRYIIKPIVPGLPPILDTKLVMKEVFQELMKRPGILCYADPKIEDALVISWAHERPDAKSKK